MCTLPSSPLSCAAPELTSAYIHVPKCHSTKIRCGGAPLRYAAPYFDHWTWTTAVDGSHDVDEIVRALPVEDGVYEIAQLELGPSMDQQPVLMLEN